MHTLGHATDWVLCSVLPEKPSGDFNVYVPDVAAGFKVRVPIAGSVASVFAKWNTGSALIYKNAGYIKNPSKAIPRALFTLTEPVLASQASISKVQDVGERVRNRFSPEVKKPATGTEGNKVIFMES